MGSGTTISVRGRSPMERNQSTGARQNTAQAPRMA